MDMICLDFHLPLLHLQILFPVSFSYILGPGDELTVSFYGSNEDSMTGFIKRDGTFNLPLLGPVNLAGFTFAEAQEFLKKRIKEELIGTEISINLNKIKIYYCLCI